MAHRHNVTATRNITRKSCVHVWLCKETRFITMIAKIEVCDDDDDIIVVRVAAFADCIFIILKLGEDEFAFDRATNVAKCIISYTMEIRRIQMSVRPTLESLGALYLPTAQISDLLVR